MPVADRKAGLLTVQSLKGLLLRRGRPGWISFLKPCPQVALCQSLPSAGLGQEKHMPGAWMDLRFHNEDISQPLT